jgi:ketosteroid isomerase-like protein
MTEHPNAVAVQRSFEAWNSGSLDVIRQYFTEDIVLAEPMKVNAEGKITEVWFLANDQRGYDQFWS